MRSPMSFFDVTPIGRIVNRFAKDMDSVDVLLPLVVKLFLLFFSSVSSLTAVFRKSDPGNNLILGLESDPKCNRARFKFILTINLCRKFYRKKSQAHHIFNNFLSINVA